MAVTVGTMGRAMRLRTVYDRARTLWRLPQGQITDRLPRVDVITCDGVHSLLPAAVAALLPQEVLAAGAWPDTLPDLLTGRGYAVRWARMGRRRLLVARYAWQLDRPPVEQVVTPQEASNVAVAYPLIVAGWPYLQGGEVCIDLPAHRDPDQEPGPVRRGRGKAARTPGLHADIPGQMAASWPSTI